MLPSIFGENLFDDFFSDPFGMMVPQGRDPLYGKHGKNLMKTDVRETENSYELDIDLPGFKKDEVNVELKNGYLTIQAAKGLDKEEQDKKGKVHPSGALCRRLQPQLLRRRGRGAGGGVRQVRGRHPDHLRAEGGQEAVAQADVHQHSVSAL